ncbi:hypothetical protein RN001_010567 [Aquatica leii]|uniref:Uncharacterized protein n=1 Tax=Aquatica leii TaxID=1421715 RepID=A0AAN7PA46_9COLE|nr:hypothetical protein RN001_010567 [Aquatica leii]
MFETVSANADLQNEINSLSMQMLHFNTKTTAAGFFDIDARLLFQIAGGGATYLLILLQFYNLNRNSSLT